MGTALRGSRSSRYRKLFRENTNREAKSQQTRNGREAMKKAKTLGVKRGKLGHNVGEEGSQNTHGTPRATLGDTAHRPLVLPPGGTPTRGDTHPLTGNPHPPWGPPTRVPPSPKNLPSASKRRQAPRKAAASKRAAAPLSMVLPRPRKSRAGPAQPLPVARRPPRL